MLITPRIKFSGNRMQCSKWLGFARGKLNALVASMEKANLNQNSGTIYPVPGVIVNFSKSFNITRINISVAGGVSKEAEKFYRWYWYAILTGGTLHYVVDIAIDSIQGVWLCGGYSDSLTPGTSFGDNAMIVQYDTDGILLNSKMITEQTEFEFANSICIDSLNNKFITLDHYSIRDDGYYDSAIVKFDSAGTVLWSTKIGLADTNTYHTDSNIGISGDIYTCGWVQDEAQVGALGANSIRWIGFVNKFSSAGVLIWKRIIYYDYTIASPLPDGHVRCERLALDSSDNIYSIGLDMGDTNFLNGVGLGFGQGTIFKLNSSGVIQWIKQIYADDPELASSDSFWSTDVIIDSEDNVYVLCIHADRTDSTNGFMRYYLIKINSSGVIQWQRRIDSPYSNGEGNYVAWGFPATYPRLALGLQDEIILLINSYDLAGEYIISKFDSTGTLIWSRSIDFKDFNVFFGSVKVDQDGDILIAGDLETTLQAFVVKLPGTGAFVGAHSSLIFSVPEVTPITSGVAIRAATGPILNGSTLYSTSTGAYETEDLGLTGITNKILITETGSP